jgi:hypothetical protein
MFEFRDTLSYDQNVLFQLVKRCVIPRTPQAGEGILEKMQSVHTVQTSSKVLYMNYQTPKRPFRDVRQHSRHIQLQFG